MELFYFTPRRLCMSGSPKIEQVLIAVGGVLSKSKTGFKEVLW
jgi:hypothetical protein